MYSSILPKHTFHHLKLQKERLRAQLNNVTYQAFTDKAIVEDKLQHMQISKALILKQITILQSTLAIAKQDKHNKEEDKNRSLWELKALNLEVIKEEKKMQDIIGSSVRQQQANKILALNLSKLQSQSDILQQQKNLLRQKIENSKRKLLASVQNLKDLRTKNTQNTIFIKQIDLKNKQITKQNSNITFQIDQSLLVINKIKADIIKINDYNNKLHSINSKVKGDVFKLQSEISMNQKVLSQLQQKHNNAQINFKHKFVMNEENNISNQALSNQNYKLYEQNKTLALQQASDRQIWEYLTQANISLKAFLSQKKILNKHTQSVLYLPETYSGSSKISNKSTYDQNAKSLSSTGAFY